MAIGDIKLKTFKIGQLDLMSGDAFFAGFNIYEDILNPYGPSLEVKVIDHKDSLGEKKINGSYDQDVELKFDGDDKILSAGGGCNLKMKLYRNKNLDDQSMMNTASGHHKQYEFRCVSPEFLNAQGNYIEKSFKGPTSEIVEHVLDKGFNTKKKKNISKTKGKRRIVIPRSHPGDVIQRMNSEHVSDKYESSVFALYQSAGKNGGEHEYHFKTFEELFEQEPVVKLKQSTTLNFDSSNQQERQNSIIWFKPSDNFFSGPRALSKTSENSIDMTSYKVVEVKQQQQKPNFKSADNSKIYDGEPSYVDKKPPVDRYIHHKANNKEKHETSAAKVKRSAFLSELAQTSGWLEVYYNPKITLGCMIELEIPQKADQPEGGEKTFNGKFLVTALRTKYRTAKEPPNCTMEIQVTKGNSWKESGGGNA